MERQVDKEERHERFQMIMLTEQSFTMQRLVLRVAINKRQQQ